MNRGRWRCYWRWPLGHRWERVFVDQSRAYKRCAGCAKTKGTFSPYPSRERFDGFADWHGDGGGSD